MLEQMNNLGARILSLFGHKAEIISKKDIDIINNSFSITSFAQVLPFVAYEEEFGLFVNKNTIGFVIEVIPIAGGDSTILNELETFFEEDLEVDCSMQFLLLSDHQTEKRLNHWKNSRPNKEPFFENLGNLRKEFILKDKRLFRNYRLIFSYSVPLKNIEIHTLSNLKKKKEKFLKSFNNISNAWVWNPKNLIETIGGLINFTLEKEKASRSWNEFENIASQIPSGGKICLQDDYMQWVNEDIYFKSFRAVDFPEYWSPLYMSNLIGEAFRDSYQIEAPFYLHYGVYCPKQSIIEKAVEVKSQLTEKQGRSSFLQRMIPALQQELKESVYIRSERVKGAKFIKTTLNAGVWSKKENFENSVTSLKSIFRINNFILAENSCIHLPSFLSSLPMCFGEYVEDLDYLKTLRTTLTSEAPAFVPIQGEWIGTITPGILFVGRRGQILNFNPFDNKTGNYNITVTGKSGSGKSVFMQELMMNGLWNGAKVFVLEIGRSFEKLCNLYGGQYLEFSGKSDICLNPFTCISVSENDSEKDNDLSVLKSIISTMAKPSEGVTDLESTFIETAILACWEKKKNNSTITDVADFLSSHSNPIAQNLGVSLFPYTKRGMHAKYFEGKNNVNLRNPFVLMELDDLNNRKDLQIVVVQLLVLSIASQAFLGDRKTPFYICIDEAYELLKGKQTENFIGTLARRLRKYKGSLVVGTQGLEDFATTPGASAALANSDWSIFFAQKDETFEKIQNLKIFHFNDSKLFAFKSLKTVHDLHSECLICDSNGGYSIARLVLDPFSDLLYNTNPDQFAQLQDLRKKGYSIHDAINYLLKLKTEVR